MNAFKVSFIASVLCAVSASAILAADETSLANFTAKLPGLDASLLEEACAEGRLVIYHGAWPQAQEAQIAAFTEAFPCIEVETFSAGVGELRERLLSEQRAGRKYADIYQDTDTATLDKMAEQDLVAEYRVQGDDLFGEGEKGEGTWYPLRRAYIGIAWNADIVSDAEAEVLTTWKGIAETSWQDRAIVVDPTAGGVGYLPMYYLHSEFGPELYEAVGKNNPRIVTGINNAVASLASGDVAIIFNASETGLLPMYEKGAPIRWTIPEPAIGPITGQVVLANAAHPAAARLYQEFAFSKEGYGAWQQFGGAPVNANFEDLRQVALEPWYSIPENQFIYKQADANAAKEAVLADFNKYIATTR
jgi:ABC-type Fe3+ transport system substrate-binding protein